MPTYRISIINRDFTATEDIHADDVNTARTEALRGALNIGTDEVCDGKSFFGAEITVQTEGTPPERFMLAIGTSPLR